MYLQDIVTYIFMLYPEHDHVFTRYSNVFMLCPEHSYAFSRHSNLSVSYPEHGTAFTELYSVRQEHCYKIFRDNRDACLRSNKELLSLLVAFLTETSGICLLYSRRSEKEGGGSEGGRGEGRGGGLIKHLT
jgi:hypothetical protein